MLEERGDAFAGLVARPSTLVKFEGLRESLRRSGGTEFLKQSLGLTHGIRRALQNRRGERASLVEQSLRWHDSLYEPHRLRSKSR